MNELKLTPEDRVARKVWLETPFKLPEVAAKPWNHQPGDLTRQAEKAEKVRHRRIRHN
jgi:hypothetical protein